MSADYATRKARNAERGPLAVDDPRHGTRNGYTNLGCRCPDCKQAWADRAMVVRQTRHQRLTGGETGPVHGSSSTYTNWACRCAACTAAHEAARRCPP